MKNFFKRLFYKRKCNTYVYIFTDTYKYVTVKNGRYTESSMQMSYPQGAFVHYIKNNKIIKEEFIVC